MKILGIDYGRRRIGIAVTDETGNYIRGLPTIDQKKQSNSISTIAEIITQESPQIVVFGVPLGPHDEETIMSREIRNIAKQVHHKIASHIVVHFIDESFTSSMAHNLLRSRKKKKRRNKDTINKLAACHILESYQRMYQCDS